MALKRARPLQENVRRGPSIRPHERFHNRVNGVWVPQEVARTIEASLPPTATIKLALIGRGRSRKNENLLQGRTFQRPSPLRLVAAPTLAVEAKVTIEVGTIDDKTTRQLMHLFRCDQLEVCG